MSWTSRNGPSNGTRSKTRNEYTNTKKKNRNYSESSDDSNWNRPKPTPSYASSGLWDDLPSNPVPPNNAWNGNMVSKWAENDRVSPQQPSKQNAWNNRDDDFPALESKPKPPPPDNVWEIRKRKANQKKALEPSNETEEERMIREAIELSKKEVEKDEVKRRQLEEEYYIQKHLLETNPTLYAEFYTDEEMAAFLPSKDEEEFKYESKSQNSFSEEEEDSEKRNNLPKNSALPSKPNQSESSGNRNAQSASTRSSKSKEKISKVVDMFGGWGKTQGNSQNVNKCNNSASSTKILPQGSSSKHRVNENVEYDRSEKEDDDWAWKTSDPEPNEIHSKASSNKKGETDEDWAWKACDSETIDSSKTHRSRKDEDHAWKTDDPESNSNSRYQGAEKDKDWAWKTEDPVPSSLQSLRKDKDEDHAWKTDDSKPNSRSKTFSSDKRADVDQDWAWKNEDPVPRNVQNNSKKNSSSKEQELSLETDVCSSLPESYGTKVNLHNDELERCENEAWGPKTQRPIDRFKSKDTNEDISWKSDDVCSSSKSSLTGAKENKNIADIAMNSISDKTHSFKNVDHSSISEENITWERRLASKPTNEDLAKSIISEYVNLDSTSKTEDQNFIASNANEPPPSKSIFEVLKNDYGKHFTIDSENVKPFIEDKPKQEDVCFLVQNTLENKSGLSGESLSAEGLNSIRPPSISDVVSSNPVKPDDDISLPLFATTFNESDQGNSAKFSVSDEFRQSFGAHFQQFQSVSTFTPVFFNPGMMNSYMMTGVNPMIPQMGMNPMMQLPGMNPMMQQPIMNPMMQQPGMNPMMQQMSMNPMVPQMSMNPMMQQVGMNPMMSPMGVNPMMQHMSIYKHMFGDSILPHSALQGSTPTEGSIDLNQFIPPPTDNSNQTYGFGDSPQMSSDWVEAPNPGRDELLDQFLQGLAMNDEHSIAAPTMPQNGHLSIESDAATNSAVFPVPSSANGAASSTLTMATSAMSNEDQTFQSMRNASRYASERQVEVRQPASMPGWGRKKR